jgi:hypothetical protein
VHFSLTRLILGSIASLVSIIVLVALAALWRLSQGPVSVAFLIPYLQDAFTLGEGGVETSVRDAILTWSREEDRLEIRTLDVVLRSPAGETLAQVPDLALRLSVPALLRGRVVPTAVEVSRVQARVTRDRQGQFSLGFWTSDEEAGQQMPAAPESESFIAMLLRRTEPGGSLAELTRIGIRDAALSLYDESSGTLFRAPRSQLVLERESGAVRARTRLDIELDGRTVSISAEGRYDLASGAVGGTAAFSALDLAVLGRRFAALSELAGADVPINGRVRFAMGADRRLGELEVEASAGAGTIAVRQLKQPVPVDGATFHGVLPATFDSVRIVHLSLNSQGTVVEATGSVSFGAGLGVNVEGRLRNLPVDRLGALWPEDISKNARTWIIANIRGGTVPAASFHARLTPEQIARGTIPADAVGLEFEVTGTSIDYLRPMPKLAGVAATARINARRMEMTARAGSAAGVVLNSSRMVITGLSERDQVAEVTFEAAGKVPAILALIDNQPLALVRKVGLDPAKTAGDAVVQANLRVPLESRLKIDDLGVRTEARVTGFSLPGVRENIDLTDGALVLTADTKRLEAGGTAALNGVPVKLRWREVFEGGGAYPSRYDVSGEVNDEGRKALGFDTAPFVSGPMQVEASIHAGPRGAALVEAKFDLQRAALDIAQAYWTKPAGTAATADLRALFEPGRPTQLDAKLSAGDSEVQGRIALNDGRFAGAQIARLRLPLIEGSGSVDHPADGSWRIQLSGPRIDMTKFLDDAMSGPPAPKTGPVITAALSFDRAVLADKVEVNTFRANARVAAGTLRQLDVRSTAGQSHTLHIDIVPDGKRRKLALDSTDAGLVLRFLGIGDTKGGTVHVTGEFQDDLPGEPLKARAQISDFTITDAPLLARLLAVGSLTGVANLLTGEGISFSSAEIPFTQTGDEVKVEGAKAHGSSLGMTAEGTINTADKRLALSGSLAPAYFINSLPGKIPLIGRIFESRPGEGVFGFTYRVRGAYENPEVLVNPVSLFAPGFLRRLFELSPGSPNEPDTPPAPPPEPVDR